MNELIDRICAALNAHDLDAFVACYLADATIEDGYDTVIVRGHDGLRERYGPMFAGFPEMHVETLHRIESGPFVVQHERWTGRGEPSSHVCVFLVEDGLVRRERILR
jgi:hypothetical protein